MSPRLFGTDGIRGQANKHPMTVAVCIALGEVLAQTLGKSRKEILIGRDTRESGPIFEDAVIAGIAAAGCNPVSLGIIPTPGVATLTKNRKAAAGIVISASHNPWQDNGLKIFGPDGCKLSQENERQLDIAIQTALLANPTLPPGMGHIEHCKNAHFEYIRTLTDTFKGQINSNFPIVIDCANGAASEIAPRVFKLLDIPVHPLSHSPNGKNINHNCGAMHPKHCANQIKTRGCRLGVAFDGDADRAIFIDDKGEVVPGEVILALLAEYSTPRKYPLITTIMANSGLDDYLKPLNIPIIRTNVGDRNVALAMTKNGSLVGGEESGHIILSEYSTTGDGIIAALEVIHILQKNSLKLSDYRRRIQLYPRTLLSFEVPKKISVDDLPNTQTVLRKIELESSNPPHILVRPSGTENKMRVLVEGPDANSNQHWAQKIRDVILEELRD